MQDFVEGNTPYMRSMFGTKRHCSIFLVHTAPLRNPLPAQYISDSLMRCVRRHLRGKSEWTWFVFKNQWLKKGQTCLNTLCLIWRYLCSSSKKKGKKWIKIKVKALMVSKFRTFSVKRGDHPTMNSHESDNRQFSSRKCLLFGDEPSLTFSWKSFERKFPSNWKKYCLLQNDIQWFRWRRNSSGCEHEWTCLSFLESFISRVALKTLKLFSILKISHLISGDWFSESVLSKCRIWVGGLWGRRCFSFGNIKLSLFN